MYQFTLTERIHESCKRAYQAHNSDGKKDGEDNVEILDEVKQICKDAAVSKEKDDAEPRLISLDAIKWVSSKLLAGSPTNVKDNKTTSENRPIYINELLRGSSIYIEKPKPKPRNPELEKRLSEIQHQIEEIEYNKMVRGVTRPSTALQTKPANSIFSVVPGTHSLDNDFSAKPVTQELKEVNKQVSVIFNILFSVVGVWFTIYYVTSSLTSDVGIRILIGMFAGIFIAIAETYLYLAVERRNQAGNNNEKKIGKPRKSD